MPGPKVVRLHGAPQAQGAGAPPPSRTDDELMLLVRAGSRDAMAVLAGRYIGPLTSFCAKLTGDAGAAEDIVQETFLRLWLRRAEYRPQGRVAALLYTVARNLCHNRARDTRRLGRHVAPNSGAIDIERLRVATDDADVVLAQERQRDALRAVGQLPEAMREALLLRFDAELPYDAIAAIVGANESTVRSRVHHALLRLRDLVKKDER